MVAQLSNSLTSKVVQLFGVVCACVYTFVRMSSSDVSSRTQSTVSTQSSAVIRASSRSSHGSSSYVSRRSRSRSPARKVRKLERKIHRLEERLEDAPNEKSFKFTSNKDQYTLNIRVLKDLRAAKRYAKSRRARRRIRRAIEKLECRNKHIRIADSSKAGWKAVELYKTDDLADNPEDDRRIKKCDTSERWSS